MLHLPLSPVLSSIHPFTPMGEWGEDKFTHLGDVASKAINDIDYMKTTNTMTIRSITSVAASVAASVVASVMFLILAYGIGDAIINAPEAIETTVAPQSEMPNFSKTRTNECV